MLLLGLSDEHAPLQQQCLGLVEGVGMAFSHIQPLAADQVGQNRPTILVTCQAGQDWEKAGRGRGGGVFQQNVMKGEAGVMELNRQGKARRGRMMLLRWVGVWALMSSGLVSSGISVLEFRMKERQPQNCSSAAAQL